MRPAKTPRRIKSRPRYGAPKTLVSALRDQDPERECTPRAHGSVQRTGRSSCDKVEVLRSAGDNSIVIERLTGKSSSTRPASRANSLSQKDAEALLAAIRVLRAEGPSLGRPLVDSVKASRHKNMKELRPGSTGRTEIRVLFAFDLRRRAILLIGGDKSRDWQGWYRKHIPIADQRFEEHREALKAASKKKGKRGGPR